LEQDSSYSERCVEEEFAFQGQVLDLESREEGLPHRYDGGFQGEAKQELLQVMTPSCVSVDWVQ
jgi:hypothetical protein